MPESEKKPPRLWIDPARVPRPKIYFAPPEQSVEDYLLNRYLELADLALKEPVEND